MTKENYEVLEAIRKVRRQNSEKKKLMSIPERMEYDRRIHEQFEKEFAAVKPDYDRFPFLRNPKKEKTDEKNN
ncbi:MAG: hypothetical protein LBU34_00875 [Planctomycetaceae bacterium]|jgi:hypothetical protein|nr:hypothetical protein [Planctomycetaceae bacterium]